MVAIPQSGLLAQVSSLRLPSGHSGPVLTLSNAARTSLPNPTSCVLTITIVIIKEIKQTVESCSESWSPFSLNG